jgi:hypothetical protein
LLIDGKRGMITAEQVAELLMILSFINPLTSLVAEKAAHEKTHKDTGQLSLSRYMNWLNNLPD